MKKALLSFCMVGFFVGNVFGIFGDSSGLASESASGLLASESSPDINRVPTPPQQQKRYNIAAGNWNFAPPQIQNQQTQNVSKNRLPKAKIEKMRRHQQSSDASKAQKKMRKRQNKLAKKPTSSQRSTNFFVSGLKKIGIPVSKNEKKEILSVLTGIYRIIYQPNVAIEDKINNINQNQDILSWINKFTAQFAKDDPSDSKNIQDLLKRTIKPLLDYLPLERDRQEVLNSLGYLVDTSWKANSTAIVPTTVAVLTPTTVAVPTAVAAAPTAAPAAAPTAVPTAAPTAVVPTAVPTAVAAAPTAVPTAAPTAAPIVVAVPTTVAVPTAVPATPLPSTVAVPLASSVAISTAPSIVSSFNSAAITN